MADRIPLIVNPTASQIQEFNESTDSLLGAIPIGGIIMWSGSIATIPTNYALCNGSNGTPDLRNRFIIGANVDDSSVAKSDIETGTYSGSNIPKQFGGFKNAILISHTHTQTGGGTDDDGGPNVPGGNGSGTQSNISTTGINVNNAASTTQTGCDANLPPYFALAYIMRTS